MSLFTTSLNSGSNGNCFYVGNEHEAVLVDAGISCREIEKRMKRLGLTMQKVRAVLVTHEHSDHIRGINTLHKKHKLPVYITHSTLRHGGLSLDPDSVISFQPYQPIQIGQLYITAFPKAHDASDPYSFIVGCNGVKVGIFTDIGNPCDHVINHFKQCNAAFLETNYDEEMLENGSYPYHLKRRIRGGQGHLSNKQALELFQTHRPSFMTHLFLSHLSQNNNDPDLVLNLFNKHAGKTRIILASRYEETKVYQISAETISNALVSYTQLSLSL